MNELKQSIQVIGIELRTTNDNGRSFKEIPPFWQRFLQENYQKQIANKLNNDIYAVYTHFENQGKNNQGLYSLILGYSVKSNSIPPKGFTAVTIPEGNYRIFPVEAGRQDKVGEVWQSIWSLPDGEKSNWTFTCEFERYRDSGEIDIFIGLDN